MPAQARLGDRSHADGDSHGCPACPHSVIGPAIAGSPTVLINGKPALRVKDPGTAVPCCGMNIWEALAGSSSVFINGLPAHRVGDATLHCKHTIGKMLEGSADVFTG